MEVSLEILLLEEGEQYFYKCSCGRPRKAVFVDEVLGKVKDRAVEYNVDVYTISRESIYCMECGELLATAVKSIPTV